MAITQDEIDRFHRFTSDKVTNGGADMTFSAAFLYANLAGPIEHAR